MDVFFKKKSVLTEDMDTEESVEVDRISFSSLHESCDDDLFMSVRESPIQPSSQFADAEDMFLSCRHSEYPSEYTASCTGVLAEALTTRLEALCTENEIIKDVPIYLEESVDETWIDDDAFLATLPSLDNYGPLPSIVGEQPYWSTHQQHLRDLRQADAEFSNDLECMNVCIYSSSLALAALEEARWLNDISKDPVLSRLVHEVDPKFPLAMRQQADTEDSDVFCSSPTGSEEHRKSASSEDNFHLNTRRPSMPVPEKATVRSSWEGVDEIVLRRKPHACWSYLAAAALHKAFCLDPVRDRRVSLWVCDMIKHFDKLLSLPSSFSYSSELIVDGQLVLLRGSSEWAPPRDAWIFTPVKMDSNRLLLENQKFRCAGCGMKVDKEYTKRVRFCEYYGKLFCQCCHQGSKSIIPSKILYQWSFNEFSVSDRAERFLREAKDQPAIHVQTLAPELVNKIGVLKRVIQMREKLGFLWEFIKMCPIAEDTVTQSGNLKTLFTSLERHLLLSTDVFSLSDLARVHNKDMASLLEPIVYYGKCHVEGCQSCKAHAFVCSLCSDATDLLFPFQLEKVVRCSRCESLSHIKCDAKRRRKSTGTTDGNDCTKCLQMQKIRS